MCHRLLSLIDAGDYMIELRKGSKVPYPEKLFEGYNKYDNILCANVDAGKMKMILSHFIDMHTEPLFFILEMPTNRNDEIKMHQDLVGKLHKDIYYIDGCTQKKALDILDKIGQLLINDGLCSFGFGGHLSNDEIMIEKYNVVTIFSENLDRFNGFFEQNGINKLDLFITAWDTFSQEYPGKSESIITDGKSIYDIPELLSDWGIYFAERVEE